MRTIFTNYLIREDTSKHVFDQGRLSCILHLQLKSIEKHLRKFINIHLFSNICRVAFIVLESITKFFRNVIFLITVP